MPNHQWTRCDNFLAISGYHGTGPSPFKILLMLALSANYYLKNKQIMINILIQLPLSEISVSPKNFENLRLPRTT